MPTPSSTSDYKLPLPTRQDIVNWVEKAHKTLSNDKAMVKNSFDVCGITTTDLMKVRSGLFYEKCMANAKSLLEDDVEENEDEPFNL